MGSALMVSCSLPSLHVLPQDSTTNLLDSNNDDYETETKRQYSTHIYTSLLWMLRVVFSATSFSVS